MILIILDVKDRILKKRIKYTFNQIMTYLGYLYEIKNSINKNLTNNKKYSLLIYYGNKTLNINHKKNIVQIIPNKFKKIREEKTKLYYFKNKKAAIFNRDIILESFMILSREEEIDSKYLDEHKRFIAEKSKTFDYLMEPIVNKYAIILDKLIKNFYESNSTPLIQKCQWPKNKKFAVCLTHDVDIVKFKKADFFSINKIIDFIKNKNPYWQFDKIIYLEQKYNFKSTFFFCVEKKHNFDPNYSIKEKKIANIIQTIIGKGNEVGLHLSYLSYSNQEIMEMEKNKLKSLVGNCIGVRTHFLRFRVPDTWILENNSGFYYDSSLSYSSDIGYRGGFSWVYTPYAVGSEKEIKIFELPLSVMDSTLFLKNKTADNAWISLKKLFYNAERFNGVVVLDWHQRVFNEKYFRNYFSVYKKCLNYFKEKDVFVSSANSVIDWINKRNSVSILRKVNKNKIDILIKSTTNINNFAIKISYNNIKLKSYNSKNCRIIGNKEGSIIIIKKINKNKKIKIELIK
jgi:hypothetical protein|tara:strand:+ start:1191 stop:2732 length:1542 start_codon:yes stop_codon:yes gene_type:complete